MFGWCLPIMFCAVFFRGCNNNSRTLLRVLKLRDLPGNGIVDTVLVELASFPPVLLDTKRLQGETAVQPSCLPCQAPITFRGAIS
jgi:hypothetical protein